MLTLESRVQPAPGVVVRESGDELVVVAPAQGKYLVLNRTGAAVFHHMNGETPLRDIAGALSQDFQAPVDRVQADVLHLAAQLLERGMIVLMEG